MTLEITKEILGGHNGHFAEVTFRWNKPVNDKPTLVVLHKDKVVFAGLMENK